MQRVNKNEILQRFKDFAGHPAPDGINALPSTFCEANPPGNLDFLRRLRFEAADILDRGDSLISTQDIPFGQKENRRLLFFVSTLGKMRAGNDVSAASIKVLKTGLAAAEKISRYHNLKVTAAEKESEIIRTQLRAQILQDEFDLQTGLQGWLKVYEFDRFSLLKNARQSDGTISLAMATVESIDYAIHRKCVEAFMGCSGMFGVPPEQKRLTQCLGFLREDIKRNTSVFEATQDVLKQLEEVYLSLGWAVPSQGKSLPVPDNLYHFPCRHLQPDL
jgi:hypothetical protein